MTLTYDQYAELLLRWCEFRGDSLKNYFPLKGGWEAWVQADYAAFVLTWNSTVDILREVPIYVNRRQRCDWLFNNTDPTVTQKIAIEIKCQSFDNRDAFTAGVGEDIAKLNQLNISKREYEVLTLICSGMSNQQIAQTMFVSENTVKKHITSLFLKLDVERRTEAVRKARDLSLVKG